MCNEPLQTPSMTILYYTLWTHMKWYASCPCVSNLLCVGIFKVSHSLQWCVLCTFCLHYKGHRCSVSGCGKVLVIDENMKNHRSVCAASEAGYLQYDGLPGHVKTGCTNTPEQRSYFCHLHKPRALTSPSSNANTVIESVLVKKVTRSITYYKVNH